MYNFNLLENQTEVSPGVALLLTVLFILIAGTAIFFLYRGIRRERNRYIADKLKIGQLSKDAFDDMIKRRIKVAKKNTHFSVMFIKILNGKDLVLSLGAKQYDAFIITLTDRLYAVLPKNSKVCEYEEDVLAVFIDENLDEKSLSDVSNFCVMECIKPITLVTKVKVTAEIDLGAIAYENSSGFSAETFLLNAERALDNAVKGGSNRFSVYSPEMDYNEDEAYQLYRRIKTAAAKNEFTLYYEPIYAGLKTIIGYESLPRWENADLGVLKEEKFLPALMQSGEDKKVTAALFGKLLSDAEEYFARHTEENDVTFSFNAVKKQISSVGYADDLYRISKKHKIDPQRICIEIGDYREPATLDNIKKLQNYGFKIAIDGLDNADSETLGEIQSISPEWIKLPAAFIMQTKSNFFYKGVLEMIENYTRERAAKLIVTNVSTEEEAAYVAELKLQFLQGAAFASELPKAE